MPPVSMRDPRPSGGPPYWQGGDQIWLATQGWLLGQLELPPTELFPHVQQYLQAVTGLLAESQTIETRRRLCSIVT